MHGVRIDACGECMCVHVHGGAWVNCMVWNAWESTAGWPGAELHACLGVHACMYAGGCTRMVHAGCMGGLEVLQRCRVGVRCTCMESDRVHVYMHGVTIL